MRLYLSSFRLGERAEHFLDLVRGHGPVAVVANAMDGTDAQRRRAAVQLEVDALAGIGLDAVEVDLREHTGDAKGLAARLRRHPALWVRGGNAFVLRAAMARSGADAAIVELVAQDALVYAGYSAGPCVAAPSLHGLEAVDDVAEVQRTYGCGVVWQGLGLLQQPFVPHVDSPAHPETADCTRLARRWDREGVAHHALRDGQALVVDGDSIVVV
jgi:dipeptidase E